MSKQGKANVMLILASMIWGAAFVAQSVGMEYVGPFTFMACRMLLGTVVLLPVIALRRRKFPESRLSPEQRKDLIKAGVSCGLIMFVAAILQQFGLMLTSAGKTGFITTLYVVLVPVIGLLLGRRASLNIWISVAVATAALYLLCVTEDFTIGTGELLTLGCALFFAFHILAIDHFSDRVDSIQFAALQFFVCGLCNLVGALLTEQISFAAIAQCWLPIGYSGILSCGVAYTLQIVGQKLTRPTIASLLLSLESVFAVLFGALLLHEQLRLPEYIGCVLMFGAIVLAQLPTKKGAAV